MTCQGCEQRREWVKKQYERSKERMLRVFKSLGIVDPTEQQINRAEYTGSSSVGSSDPNQQRTERTD